MMLALALRSSRRCSSSAQNLTNILKQNASLALLALGMYVVIVTAGIDLCGRLDHGARHGGAGDCQSRPGCRGRSCC